MEQRLQRALAAAGVASRRGAEDLIRQGRVTVDGRVAELGGVVDPETQVIAVDGRPVDAQAKEYWLLNKPAGVVSTASDPQGRPTVVDCVPTGARLFPVGRLDRDTTGLLVLTNDGDLAYRLLHPRYGVEKEYRIRAKGLISAGAVEQLRRGVRLDDGWTAPAQVDIIARTDGETRLVLVIHEGRKRQVRRMLDVVGYPVVRLHRSRVDGLTDRGLALGTARRLTPAEVERLRSAGEGRQET